NGQDTDNAGTPLPAGRSSQAAEKETGTGETAAAGEETAANEQTQKEQAAVTGDDASAVEQTQKERPAPPKAAPVEQKTEEKPPADPVQKATDTAAAHKTQPAAKTDVRPAGKQPAADSGGGNVTYITYKVQRGDTFWLIAQKFGLPMTELLAANKMTENTILYEGMVLTIPQHQVPEKTTPGPQYGELLDWWTEAQYLWPIGTNARVTDLATGKTFTVKRSYGAFHADVEPLTAADSATMKAIWGGWSWATRPVVVEVNGRRIAASSHAMPHSIQTITDNGFDGHFCIHFLNSTRHSDNQMQPDHQENVRRAAGLM
ncbi:MAG TPA: LysM peptidoglycan-binding domain-containing protein, partial [Firmicutes bacterium]|nr:LysM peptidoglycan-binding domain-containing protein [Bacillota bacterium]